jgi:ribulose-5-phosphate 4-epimerase/fuculose-1-phosphate aldolase
MMGYLSEKTRVRDQICRVGKSIFDRGLTFGSTGNISVRLTDGSVLMTPTNASLGNLEPDRLSLIDAEGTHIDGEKPTKEAFLHQCVYCQRPQSHAVVHLHSTYSVAVSVMAKIDPCDVLPPLTAYYVMRVGRLPLIPYFAPGDARLARAVEEKMGNSHAVLLANHGPIVAGSSLEEAQYATEELEETARIFMLLQGHETRPLTQDQVNNLRR